MTESLPKNTLTCAQALTAARGLGLERLDAQLLLLHALGKPGTDRAWLLTHDTTPLPAEATQCFRELSLRRAGGEPLAYLVGSKEFFGLELQVDGRVLVPRPDTETLVEWALQQLAQTDMPASARVLDLGTGSGAIALALKKTRPALDVTAVDASSDALAVAAANAGQHQLPVHFLQGNWFENVSARFHLIVSNPPYVADADPHLPALRHEPPQALTAGKDGLDDLRRIIEQAPAYLQPQGWLLLEHGYDQARAVCELLRQRGFGDVQSRADLAGIPRCSGGRWPDPAPGTGSQTAG
ncbi:MULTISPECIES: peptide chain release factor N(5)-glutamine methyltransferase [unclassified Polaromonas]|uniref:peptide chain release factor N(5)-glutamine methyltransferase n=1 Tax=unclassified Polaromonas TaxID=2638319 RepID=UPI000BD2D9E7|nr:MULTISPECIES: peptide chain release factor N(5)-glutamine methyltransferase [unclassified Polaromonas]OYY35946.1 MAG: protein-(glutamine-N5) methyltransferase, release factor-specific [Polaromonas sp. 35-63-35]OYZ19750.1 MAG: protein-(glutamine-N5) methyltransferase, release factor-specific [Polaromonas sp. 16-63-31]OYZ79983.1 MAG: protein-(glutamine-N5) methyltransferase, release factor-specific [Polaromonas sp. 24-63-21]OZA52100.1 MAG: protein-(glutamine-N5) methyltransferase, release fact